MSLKVHGLSYIHPNKDILFPNISFPVSEGEKCGAVQFILTQPLINC